MRCCCRKKPHLVVNAEKRSTCIAALHSLLNKLSLASVHICIRTSSAATALCRMPPAADLLKSISTPCPLFDFAVPLRLSRPSPRRLTRSQAAGGRKQAAAPSLLWAAGHGENVHHPGGRTPHLRRLLQQHGSGAERVGRPRHRRREAADSGLRKLTDAVRVRALSAALQLCKSSQFHGDTSGDTYRLVTCHAPVRPAGRISSSLSWMSVMR